MSKEYLSTYLNDHLAGSVAALEIVEHLLTEATAAHLKSFFAQLKTDIEADREELVNFMNRLDVSQSRIRKASVWIAEQFMEAKIEMDDDDRGMLRRLERLEVLSLGIEGKLRLWLALDAASVHDTSLRGLDYARLAQRARDQRDRVEPLRIAAAQSALTLAA